MSKTRFSKTEQKITVKLMKNQNFFSLEKFRITHTDWRTVDFNRHAGVAVKQKLR